MQVFSVLHLIFFRQVDKIQQVLTLLHKIEFTWVTANFDPATLNWSYADTEWEFCEVFDHSKSGKHDLDEEAILTQRRKSTRGQIRMNFLYSRSREWTEQADTKDKASVKRYRFSWHAEMTLCLSDSSSCPHSQAGQDCPNKQVLHTQPQPWPKSDSHLRKKRTSESVQCVFTVGTRDFSKQLQQLPVSKNPKQRPYYKYDYYDYPVMPYGLVNAPAVFHTFINAVLRDFLHSCVIIYIECIFIFSRTEAEHITQVHAVLLKNNP